ncbi:TDP-N-acetylfucosamine:lipid II N-acetylfucosaminyltransferase [Vibrio chagasii]
MLILNVMMVNKFSIPFIRFVENEIDNQKVKYFCYGNIPPKDILSLSNSFYSKSILFRYISMLYFMCKSERIVLHGLIDFKVVLLLFFNPFLLKKCYWLMMGVDLYSYKLDKSKKLYKLKEFFRSKVIRNIGFLVTSVDGDYELAKKWYKTIGKRLDMYTFPNSVYTPLSTKDTSTKDTSTKKKKKVLIGNSAEPTNNHMEILSSLKDFDIEGIEFYIPLSYGDKSYAKYIEKEAKLILGDNVIILTDFLDINEYNLILSEIDIAIFNHKRQQALSVIRTLLGNGAKVYMRRDVTSFDMFSKLGVKVFDFSDFNLNKDFYERESNKDIITSFYSPTKLKLNLEELFS